MKKSNKILLGGFVVVLLLITSIHVSIYAKYKNGNYIVDSTSYGSDMVMYPNVLNITIHNMNGAILHFSDKTSVEKVKEGLVKIAQTKDSLVITGHGYASSEGSILPVNITVPANASIRAFNSNLTFEKGKTDAQSAATIFLDKSDALFRGTQDALALQQLKIAALNNSTIRLGQMTKVGVLEVLLERSTISMSDADAGALSITTDSVSTISLQTKLLLKAKITTTGSGN